MSREQSTRRPKCPATGKQCQGSHPLQCFDGAACLRLQQEGRRERAAAQAAGGEPVSTTTEHHETDITASRAFRVKASPDGSEYVLEWQTITGTIMTVTSIKISREGLRTTLEVLDGLRDVLP